MPPRLWRCYNPSVKHLSPSRFGFVLLLVPGLLTGCATQEEGFEPGHAEQVPFAQVKASPDAYRGQTLMLGGKVLSAKRLKEGTRIEILQLPLDGALRPEFDLTRSRGRFVAMQREFLDPATLPPGTSLTVTGEVTGSVTMPLDETDYTYPVLEIKQMKVWTEAAEGPRLRPYAGPDGYWGPYWSPYWRPRPYW